MKKAQLRKIIRESIKKDLLEINPLNEVQCPCFANKHMSAGSEPLMCTNSTGNVVNVTGCCGSGAGSADAPVHALCNGKTCDNLDYNSPGCWDNIHREKEKKTQIAHTNANPQQTGFPRPTSQIEPSIDKMMREATKNMMLEYTYTQAEGDAVCAGAGHGPMTGYNCVDDGSGVTETCTISCEGGMVTVGGDNNPPLALDKTRTKQQDDGEVTNFRITSIGENGEKGKTIKANRNHKVIRNLDLTNATKIKQLTKGQDPSKEDRLNEGILCCWLRGGCCGWEQKFPFPHMDRRLEHYAGYVIEWNACCGNSSKGGCC